MTDLIQEQPPVPEPNNASSAVKHASKVGVMLIILGVLSFFCGTCRTAIPLVGKQLGSLTEIFNDKEFKDAMKESTPEKQKEMDDAVVVLKDMGASLEKNKVPLVTFGLVGVFIALFYIFCGIAVKNEQPYARNLFYVLVAVYLIWKGASWYLFSNTTDKVVKSYYEVSYLGLAVNVAIFIFAFIVQKDVFSDRSKEFPPV